MTKILIAEDEKAIADLIKLSLMSEGYLCKCTYDGKTAADMMENEAFDLALLDIMLPEIDGYELLEYAGYYNTPVIFITAKTDLPDKVRGLRAGAEDYISKPFEIQELLARVDNVLRRRRRDERLTLFGNIVIDMDARLVAKNGTAINLTAKEFDLLVYLANNRNRALHRWQIYAAVWGSDHMGDSRTVDLHIQRIRKKLSLESQIVPVYKIGYRMEGEK